MTREEWTNNAAIEYGKQASSDSIRSKAAAYDFAQGIKYADKNPKSLWISVEDDLPCNHKELILYGVYTKQVMVADHEGCIGIQRMKKSCNGIIGVEPWWQWEIPSVVYYWMPIPELPKE